MAEIGDVTVFSQTDASNNTGTNPGWPEGMPPSRVNDAARALQGAVTREWNWRNFTLTSTGSANAYVLTYTVAPAGLTVIVGQEFSFITNFANTGAATLNINSLGAVTIKKDVAGVLTDLASADIASGNYIKVNYNGTFFVLSGRQSGVALLASANTFTATQTLTVDDAVNSSTSDVIALNHTTSGTAAAGIGIRLPFGLENGSGTLVSPAAAIAAIFDTVTAAAETAHFNFNTRQAGAIATRLSIGAGIYTLNATGGDKGADTFNSVGYYVNGTPVELGVQTNTATTSGTSILFGSIPSGVRKIIIQFNGVSTSGTSITQVQIGSGSVLATGYLGTITAAGSSVGSANHNTGFQISFGAGDTAAAVRHGSLTLSNVAGNVWAISGVIGLSNSALSCFLGGTVTLGGVLDRINITTVGGADTFDAGSVSLVY